MATNCLATGCGLSGRLMLVAKRLGAFLTALRLARQMGCGLGQQLQTPACPRVTVDKGPNEWFSGGVRASVGVWWGCDREL